ncbi:MAG: polyribonucleotide nucleotidyltransferase [Spirochaetia bacterium]|nr:polyribonucleotide nucleotidyltransferase [Spirochaetia bacterium]
MFTYEEIDIRGHKYILETGKWAKQAGGSVVVRWNNMVIMSNTTVAPEAKDGMDFFPMTVEYREKFYASGRIPGGFFKREARPSEKETLTSRLTDRPLRPLFPEGFVNEIQVFVTLLSTDCIYPAQIHSITAASASLMISEAPFHGPVAGVQVGRVNGNFILFPTNDELEKSEFNLMLAGTKNAVTMIEGHANEVSEDIIIEAIKIGHEEIKKLCEIQIKLKDKIGKEKMPDTVPEDVSELKKIVHELAFKEMSEANKNTQKHVRQENIDQVKTITLEKLQTKWESESIDKDIIKHSLKKASEVIAELEVDIVRDQIFDKAIRADGRKLDEIRDITIETGVLPSTHGSSVFTRGETQSLGVVTLGTSSSAQIIDDIEGESKRSFYLHYNFPPFSVGEVKRFSGPGRREIGHGKLAENALKAVLPAQENFPYVIRVVSEILESNGSSSMATICSGSLAMMDAGIPVKAPVAGIAMGLITKGDKHAILSDIAGLEDHFGDMDFKVAGTENGVTAFQLDLKIQGIGTEIMRKALEQAKKGRLHILEKMNATLKQARTELSPNAPRLLTLKIHKDKIGELIGPGGKNIKMLTEKTGAEILIDAEGIVTIASSDSVAAQNAKKLIEDQFREPEMNAVYEGPVKKIAEFGAFIEIMPGKDGLCHISKISDKRVENVNDVLKEGDIVKVRVIGYDAKTGKTSLSIRDV